MGLTKQERIERTKQAMARGAARQQVDLTRYPQDVSRVLTEVCTLWGLLPPEAKGPKGFWIKGARELIDACAEFGVDLVRELHNDWKQDGRKLIISSPASLTNLARDKAARMRMEGQDGSEARRQYYSGGEFAEFINH